MAKFKDLLSLIRFEHTLFALPFALASAVVAANGIPPLPILGWILLAMVGARSAAMGFNRIADRFIDAANPRTKTRELPSGKIKLVEAWTLVIFSTILFITAAAMLNPLCLYLSPIALLIIFGYSYCKRFTSFSHIILGLALAIAPIGAWIAVTGELTFAPIILGAAVMLWTAGFDIIYALQDLEFDKTQKLFSIPKALGAAGALNISRLMHAASIILLLEFGLLSGLGTLFYIGAGIMAACLAYEQTLVKPNDLSRVNAAFFTMNGLVSVIFFVFVLAERLLHY